MTDFLPLFPLKMVVFPDEPLNLHIFEPRYKQLIRECEQNGTTFGIPAFIDGKVMPVGTEIKLETVVKKHDNGEMDIKTRGIGLFKINTFFPVAPNKLYAGADIERLPTNTQGELALYLSIQTKMHQLFQILRIEKPLPTRGGFVVYDIAHEVGLSLEQEYELLCIPSEIERQQYVESHLERLLPIVREMERLRKKAQMNGHFKNVIPPKF